MNVPCDMITDGGGWTVIQRRVDNSTDFYLEWASYKQGFGSLTGNLWLGNDNIHRLTANGNTVLRVDLEDWEGKTLHVVYRTFKVDDERKRYKLSATDFNFSNPAPRGFLSANNKNFSTKDRDNFDWKDNNEALLYKGGWWYGGLPSSNLNGRYLGNQKDKQGMYWFSWRKYLSLKRSEMKIRHPSFN